MTAAPRQGMVYLGPALATSEANVRRHGTRLASDHPQIADQEQSGFYALHIVLQQDFNILASVTTQSQGSPDLRTREQAFSE
jgi:hypothetical protein